MTFIHCPPKKIPQLTSNTGANGDRFYTLPDGTKVASVTTVIGAKGKQSILDWRNRVGHEVANQIAAKASGRGNNVHKLCEDYLNNISRPKGMPDALEMFQAIKPLLNRIQNIHYQEQALWSKHLGMAGRVDLIAEFDGVLSVIDFKTSKRVKQADEIENYFAQCVAYALMYKEQVGKQIDQIVIIMAVDNSEPLLFIAKTRDYIQSLVDFVKFYRENVTKS